MPTLRDQGMQDAFLRGPGGNSGCYPGRGPAGNNQSLYWASEGSSEKPSVRCQRPILLPCRTLEQIPAPSACSVHKQIWRTNPIQFTQMKRVNRATIHTHPCILSD